MTTASGVVAVILAHDSLGVLPRVVQAVHGQTWRPAETIVVDNGSRDGTAVLCRRLVPGITLLALPDDPGSAPDTTRAGRRRWAVRPASSCGPSSTIACPRRTAWRRW